MSAFSAGKKKQKMRCKMNKTKFIFSFCLVLIFLFCFAFAEQTHKTASGIREINAEQTRVPSSNLTPESSPAGVEEVALQGITSLPKSANFILVTDVLDGFGGQKRGNSCDLSYFAGGQSSPIGMGGSSNFKLSAGFISSTWVKCGDANASGNVDVGDVVYLINYLFKGGPPPKPFQAGDANCSGTVDIGDVVYLINYLYHGGPAPVC